MSTIFTNEELQSRIPVWNALSEFYLDTELDKTDYKILAKTFSKSPYTLSEIRSINRREVFLVLQTNLMSIAGEWAGFDEEWLTKRIIHSIVRRNQFQRILNDVSYVFLGWMIKLHFKSISEFIKTKNAK